MKTFSLIALALGLAGPLTLAQSSLEIPPPSAPLVQKAPANAEWTVAARLPETQQTEPVAVTPSTSPKVDSRILLVHSTQTGKVKRDQITYADKRQAEFWYVENWFLTTNAQGESEIYDRSVSIPAEMGEIRLSPSVTSGYPGLDWLTLGNYKSVVALEKRQAYHYDNGDYEAWIDVETKLPLAFKADGIVYTFTFNEPPVTSLTLPPGHLAAYQKVSKLMERRRKLADDITRQKSIQP